MSGITPVDTPFASSHTLSLPMLFQQIGMSLWITTYQAGKLIIARAADGTLNTHFRNFHVPMGLAFDRERLAVCTRTRIEEFRNNPAAAPRLEPVGRHDSLFLPRWSHTTGFIAGHEIAYSGDTIWIVNTRFSCLCTLDKEHNFVPRWRPKFVTALTPEDRCHLNGMALVDGQPRFVTALGATDSNAAWRETKATGGVLIDIPSGEFICRGLSMPHSPRWYNGKLWVLESGRGSLSIVDQASGKLIDVALFPGFTRGLEFVGHFAFVGLSQVRETAIFSGIPITERIPIEERSCGCWVVDLRSGNIVAFLRFDGGVREVFAVYPMLGKRFPELLNQDDDEPINESFILPDDALRDVPTELRK